MRRPGKEDKVHDVIAQWPDQPNVSIFRYVHRSPAAPRLLADLTKELGDAKQLGDVAQRLGAAQDGLVRIGCACYTTADEVVKVAPLA